MDKKGELLAQPRERLEFSDLREGDTINITLGRDEEAFRYTFLVRSSPTSWPEGELIETQPDGTVSDSIPFTLHGCGKWTNRQQNPVQKQHTAFTPYYEGLIVGSFLFGKQPDAPDRLVFDKPRQEISAIEVVRPD